MWLCCRLQRRSSVRVVQGYVEPKLHASAGKGCVNSSKNIPQVRSARWVSGYIVKTSTVSIYVYKIALH
jgi:hypothetical protein